LFLPQPIAGGAAVLIILHQLILIIAGNYAWLNWVTVVLAFVALPGSWLAPLLPISIPAELTPRPLTWDVALIGLAAWTVFLSIAPSKNLCSRHQFMNYCWNRWHLVNAYGAFGTVTKKRYEIVVEGTTAEDANDSSAEWRAYEFKGKPGRLDRVPPVVAPYHLRLDWLMWFLPFAVTVTSRGIIVQREEIWFLRFIEKLLEGDRATLALLKYNPFPDGPPRFVRARYFLYRFTNREERRERGETWKRTYVDDYLPPTRLHERR
jgi:hypothetical protein